MSTMTPEEAYHKAIDAGQRLPKLEPVIQQDAKLAYYYASYVIQRRWPEAEAVIQNDTESSYYYAKDVIKGRWPEAEATITQGNYKLSYISYFFSEPVVSKDQCSDFEWERAGAVGFFAPVRLFERKNSLIDIMIDNLS